MTLIEQAALVLRAYDDRAMQECGHRNVLNALRMAANHHHRLHAQARLCAPGNPAAMDEAERALGAAVALDQLADALTTEAA